MRAHFVPRAYLRGFTIASRGQQAYAIARERVFRTTIDNLCVCSDYYTAVPSEDSALFAEHEPIFASLPDKVTAGDPATMNAVPELLWALKLRNRSILDRSRYRKLIVAAQARMDFRLHAVATIAAPPGCSFITSDDPVVIFGDGQPPEQCFFLPIAPELAVASASSSFFFFEGSAASEADVALLNLIQCEQAREYVISRDLPSDPSVYQKAMPKVPQPAYSEALVGRPRQPDELILNYIAHNPKNPERRPSFLNTR